MVLNPYAIYAEFLDNFLTIIQDADARNEATFASGFLKVKKLNSAIESDDSAVPLSAVVEAGLVDKQGNFALDNEQAKVVMFSFDKVRTQAQIERIGINCSELTEMQQLVLATSIQEAINRIVSGSLKPYAENLQNITNAEQQKLISDLIQNMDSTALKQTAKHIQFNYGLTLSQNSILMINRQQRLFKQMIAEGSNVTFPDEEFTAPQAPPLPLLPSSRQIELLDELIPSLSINPDLLSQEEEQEHQAKLKLLQLYATILKMTKNDSWQVKTQWLRPGGSIQVGSQEVTLPSSISEIIKIISDELSQKHKANYLNALKQVQKVAATYEQDWYRWMRNKLPYVCSSSNLRALLEEVIKIKVDDKPTIVPSEESPSVEESPSLIAKTPQQNIGFFISAKPEKAGDDPEPAIAPSVQAPKA